MFRKLSQSEDSDLGSREERQCLVQKMQSRPGIAAAPMGQQLEEQGNRDIPPHHGEHQDIDVLLAGLPVRAVEDEFTRPRVREQEQYQPCDIGWAQWMLVEEAFQTANDRIGLGVAWEPRSRARRGARPWLGGAQRRRERGVRPDSSGIPESAPRSNASKPGERSGTRSVVACQTRFFKPLKTVGY